MNNAVFRQDKMENVRNHINVRLVQCIGRYGVEAIITKPFTNFHNRSVFSESLVAIEMRKLEMKFDKRKYIHRWYI